MAYLYGRLAIAFLNLGDTKNAMKYANLHLTCAKEMGIKDMEGVRAASLLITSLETLISLQNTTLNGSLNICKAIEDLEAEGGTYGDLGCVFDSLGQFEKTVDYNKQHLCIAETTGDKDEEAIAYGNLGNAYLGLGDFNAALHFFEHRLRIAKDLEDKAGDGGVYGHLGSTF